MIIQSKRVWLNKEYRPVQLEIKDNELIGIHPYNSQYVDAEHDNNRLVPGLGWNSEIKVGEAANIAVLDDDNQLLLSYILGQAYCPFEEEE